MLWPETILNSAFVRAGEVGSRKKYGLKLLMPKG